MRELLEEGEFILANNSEKASGGPWTWICRADGNLKSCLDLVIISADLEQYLDSMVIDTKFEFAPFRVRKVKKGVTRKIYPDHYPIVVKFKNLPARQIKSDRISTWNLKVPEGWKKYELLTNQVVKKMNKVIEDESLDIESIKKKTDAIQNKVKFQAFGKTKPPTGKKRKFRLEGEQRAAQGMEDEEEKKKILL